MAVGRSVEGPVLVSERERSGTGQEEAVRRGDGGKGGRGGGERDQHEGEEVRGGGSELSVSPFESHGPRPLPLRRPAEKTYRGRP